MSIDRRIKILKQLTPVKKLLSPEEREFVSLVSGIIVNKTINHAKEGHKISAIQQRRSEQ